MVVPTSGYDISAEQNKKKKRETEKRTEKLTKRTTQSEKEKVWEWVSRCA